MSNPNPFGRHNGEALARARAKPRPAYESPPLRPSMRQAVLEAYRLATDMDMMGEPLDFIQRRPALAAVDLHVAGQKLPIRVYGFTSAPEDA
jgi:hypothetical protein